MHDDLDGTRVGDAGWVSNCRVTRWLPPIEEKVDEATGAVTEKAEAALYHVVHEDGDEEDLDEEEAAEARACYLKHEAEGTLPGASARVTQHAEYTNKLERRAAARLTPGDLGAVGLREEMRSHALHADVITHNAIISACEKGKQW